MNLDKGNLWTFVSFFTQFLEAAVFPSSDGFPSLLCQANWELTYLIPRNVLAVCGTGIANIVEH
jgi:hypothetical protein